MNGQPVKVYPTGAFAIELKLAPGDTLFTLRATSANGKEYTKKVFFNYSLPVPEKPVTTVAIERIQVYPEGDLLFKPGDEIRFTVKALPKSVVQVLNGTRLYEMPDSVTGKMPGIYQGNYIIKPSDTFFSYRMPVQLISPDGKTARKETMSRLTVMNDTMQDVAVTRGRLAHLEYGLGDDRLGGAKIGYIDSLIPLKITGKVGSHWRVLLAKNRTAYIPDEHVTVMPKGSFAGAALTGKWYVSGDSVYDKVEVQLTGRLPYQTFHQVDPSRIVVDLFGATNNTNWITQLSNAKEIDKVDYEQISDDIFRIIIQLKHRQHWGHQVFYKGNTLVIKVKQQPADLSLQRLAIAVDAGHGGTNTGAGGPTGVAEKNLTLAVSLKLQKLLEQEGARVIMTRTKEQFFDNKERILFYRDSLPDLLLSIHLNSSADPIYAGGTSTFYRYPGFKMLNKFIYNRMLELGLKDYGNNSSFNFMLNSPTEYPNALVEMLFLSNPEEEMLIVDESFQMKAAEKMLRGIKDFLHACKD